MGMCVKCGSCGKQYTVSEALRGKKVRCKACGGAISIPADAPEDVAVAAKKQSASISGMALPLRPEGNERSSSGTMAMTVVAESVEAPGADTDAGESSNSEFDRPPELMSLKPARSGGEHAPARIGRLRPPTPYDDLLYNKLPIGLIVLGYAVPLIFQCYQAIRSSSPIAVLLAILAMMGLLIALVIPMTVRGLRTAARVMNFPLIDRPGLKALAAFFIVPVVVWVCVLSALVTVGRTNSKPMAAAMTVGVSVFTGIGLGVVVSFFVVWLLFRLDFINAIVAWFISGLAYVSGWALSVAILAGLFAGISFAQTKMAGDGGNASSGGLLAVLDRARASGRRNESAAHLRELAGSLLAYSQGQPGGELPPDFHTMLLAGALPSDTFNSPFGHPSSGPDYVYRYADGLTKGAGPSVVLGFDAAELEHGEGTNVMGGDFAVSWTSKQEFENRLAESDRAVAPIKAKAAETRAEREKQAVATAERPAATQQSVVATSTGSGQATSTGSGQAVAPAVPTAIAPSSMVAQTTAPAAVAPPVAQVPAVVPVVPFAPAPPSAPNAAPAAPMAGWTATPDAPAGRVSVRADLRYVFPNRALDLLYPVQSSSIIALGDDFADLSTTAEKAVHEVWDLRSVNRIGRGIMGPLPVKDPVLSPDGQFIAGRVTGGKGEASTYEVWSFRTGKKVQMFASGPITQAADPIVIGFIGSDRLLTLGDALQVWDIKTGTLTHQLETKAIRDGNDLVAVSAGGKLVAHLDAQDRLHMYDAANGNLLGDVPVEADRSNTPAVHGHSDRALAFSPDGSEIALFLPAGVQSRIMVWSVATGKVAADFTLTFGISTSLANRKGPPPMIWLPVGDGWLVGGDQIVDRATGVVLYRIPEHPQTGAEEYGPRRVVDNGHILLSFKSGMKGIGIQSFPLPADTIVQARNAVRGLAPQATTHSN